MRTESIADYIELNKNLTRDYQHEDNREFFTDTGRKNANGDTIFLVPIPALVWNEDALQPREIDEKYVPIDVRNNLFFCDRWR